MKMEDLDCSEWGIRSKAAALLKNEAFSDVDILVIDGNARKTYKAHKLFLAMSSREFASYFYGKTPSPDTLKIFDFSPQTVYMMLQFLYTNKVENCDMREARELYSLSKRYGIRNLQELCVDHISKHEITKDNVLYMYECAKKENYLKLLNSCRQLVSSNTKAVFETPAFVETSISVLEDILQLESLSVDSELVIIHAVVKWAHYECRRLNLDDNKYNLRECIFPLLCHIRFLSLKCNEFCDILEKYPILNAHESSLITRRILQPDVPIALPSYFCLTNTSRTPMNRLPISDSLINSDNVGNLNSILRNTMKSPILTKSPKRAKGSTSPLTLSESKHLKAITEALILLESPRSLNNKANKLSAPKSSEFLKDNFNASVQPRLLSNITNQSPVSEVAPCIKTPIKIFDFSLQETKKLLKTAFKNDVKCSISLHLLKGMINIHGIELKITQDNNSEELIKVFLNSLHSGKNSSASDTYSEKIQDGVLPITFKQPIKVVENNHLEIEVTIEDLKLNRCCIIKDPVCELKHPDFNANIVLMSNQMNELGEYFFLINRFIYSVV